MKLIALKSFPYAGKRVKPGQEFEASRSDARTLIAIRHARTMPLLAAPVVEVQVVEAVEPKPKRTYKRRDLTAENSGE